ncbi:hypothetical protein Y1Q_0015686 [Alligator mississippiensis]|uniref:Uncharacterized protein n=2 Tax=Alligator mississippiensis TaxID=8496 RepID=A0A151NNT1_ALLMI|nr:hypothetical protein Y1Q_0015686 [Alligator mississippiensis]
MDKSDLLLLIVLLSSVLLTAQASEPRCTNVSDFDNCMGNTEGFCPNSIACGCKDQKPFCKCPYYRGVWGEYWYLGEKCNQLWRTLDLILVAVLPGVALVFLVCVILQIVYYCKRDKGERKQKRQLEHKAHHNPAYTPELTDNLRDVSQQPFAEGHLTTQSMQIPKVMLKNKSFGQPQAPGRVEVHSTLFHQPLRGPVSGADHSFSHQYPQHNQFAYPGSNIPYVDYEEENPVPAMPIRQFPKYDISAFPRPDMFQSATQPMDNMERPVRPYGLKHSGNRYNY